MLTEERIARMKLKIKDKISKEYPEGLPLLAQEILKMLDGDWTDDNLEAVVNKVHEFSNKLIRDGKTRSIKDIAMQSE